MTTSLIHPTAFIHSTAKVANNVTIGPWAYIGEYVEIGEGTRIDAHAVITKWTIMGKNNHIYSHAVVGGDPQDLSYRGEETWLKMGDENIVREFVTINRGSTKSGTTYVGNKNCFFSYSHVAHDAHIGNEVLFVNNASIAGHVTVDDYAIMGAYSAAHQFTRVGAYSFLAHAAQISNDIPPFMLVKGVPGVPVTLNLVGLRRRGFSAETIRGLRKAYKLMYRQGLSLKEMEDGLAQLATETPEVQMIIDLMKDSKRGIVRKQAGRALDEE
jgi:UDP-N-acetylglucosamine acyltransferase